MTAREKTLRPIIREIWVRIPSVEKGIRKKTMNIVYKLIFAFFVCAVCGCPRTTPVVDASVNDVTVLVMDRVTTDASFDATAQ